MNAGDFHMSEHTWFQENLASYNADGLSIEERERFDRHRVACSACAQLLADARGFDEAMDKLFAPIRPAHGFENRVIDNLRSAKSRRKVWSRGMRFVAGVAALIVLGVLGSIFQGFMNAGGLPFPGTEPSVKQVAQIGLGLQNEQRTQGRTHTSLLGGIIGGKVKEEKTGDISSLQAELSDRLSEIDRLGGEHKNITTYSVKDSPPTLERTESKKELPGVRIIRGTNPLPDKLTLWPPQGPSQMDENTNFGRQPKQDSGYFQPPRLPVTATQAPALQAGQVIPGAQEAKKAKVLNNYPVADLVVPYDTPSSSTSAMNQAQELRKAFPIVDQITQAPPESSTLKIIRTAEMEFEVDSFDAAVTGITRLVSGIPGGFVLTKKSDKLPNGKVKGVVVVRMPPEKLDKFLLNVRQDLGKVGELKSERVAGQDVTKHYTDVTSQLRAARAMEERFLQMIKTGKGEIKDLVLAENELGKWRTKIEEMEGEIRYYNNQVGLSTVTITAYEKEIQAPASLMVTEKRRVQLEVDDVEKAQAAALAVVAEAKGRVSKSELKQHPGGQLQAILQFEVCAVRRQQSERATQETRHRHRSDRGSHAANSRPRQSAAGHQDDAKRCAV